MLNNLLREKSKDDLIAMIRNLESKIGSCNKCFHFQDSNAFNFGHCYILNINVGCNFYCAEFERKD